jgi:hypothetical protein
MSATLWLFSGLPFSHAVNMHDESMARCSESPFQPKT